MKEGVRRWVTVAVFVACSCRSIDERWSPLRLRGLDMPTKPPPGWLMVGSNGLGVASPDGGTGGPEVPYSVEVWAADGVAALFLLMDVAGSGPVHHVVVDVSVVKVRSGSAINIWCYEGERRDDEVVALVATPAGAGGSLSPALQAWRLNRKERKVESIGTSGIRCSDPGVD